MTLKIEKYVKIVLHDSEGRDNHSIISDNQMFIGNSCYNNKCSPYDIKLRRGIYSFECFGASGNDGNPSTTFSRGGITYGMIRILETMHLYLYIGEKGVKRGPTTFNGGGKGNCYSYAGGGATDVRLNPGEWNNSEGLKSRIMVASGGGGFADYIANQDSSDNSINSVGGGLIGNKGPKYLENGYTIEITNSIGGSQDKGGMGGYGPETTNNFQNNIERNGSFGIGGSAFYGSGGGGGGYFGGGAGKTNAGQVGAGAGGSSYISGHKGCHSVLKHSPTFETTTSEIHYSGMHFFNTRMSNGDPSTSHNGHGKIIITILDSLPAKTCKISRTKSGLLPSILLIYSSI